MNNIVKILVWIFLCGLTCHVYVRNEFWIILGNCLSSLSNITGCAARIQIQAASGQSSTYKCRRHRSWRWRKSQFESYSRSSRIAEYLESWRRTRWSSRWQKLWLNLRTAKSIVDTSASRQKSPETTESSSTYAVSPHRPLAQSRWRLGDILRETWLRDNVDAARVAHIWGVQFSELRWQSHDESWRQHRW